MLKLIEGLMSAVCVSNDTENVFSEDNEDVSLTHLINMMRNGMNEISPGLPLRAILAQISLK